MYGIEQPSSPRRGLWVIIGVVVLVLILAGLFFAFYSLVLKKDDEQATPEVTVIMTQTTLVEEKATDTVLPPSPTNTATSAPAAEATTPTSRPTAVPPTDTPMPTPTLRPPPEVITIGVRARVDIGVGLTLNLRDQPTRTGNAIAQLGHGTEVDVFDGPQEADGLRWWNVNGGEDRIGWVVDAFGEEVWLVPVAWSDQATPLTPTLSAEPTLTPTLAPPTAAPVLTPTATATTAALVTPTAIPEVTPTAAPEVTPTAAPEVTPTATATPVLTPTATPEGGIPSPTVGGRAQVTTQYQFINLRDGPGLGSETISQLANGTVVTILEGPEESDGYTWWKVDDGQGNVGWAAERTAAEVLLSPVP
jgi:hypothetical protein